VWQWLPTGPGYHYDHVLPFEPRLDVINWFCSQWWAAGFNNVKTVSWLRVYTLAWVYPRVWWVWLTISLQELLAASCGESFSFTNHRTLSISKVEMGCLLLQIGGTRQQV
jgi:hypothetical protein